MEIFFPKATVEERLKSYPMRYNFPGVEGVEKTRTAYAMCMSGGGGEGGMRFRAGTVN